MSNNSVIEHRANYYYIMVQEDYLAICSNGKCSPHCKAMILAILEHWTNTKRDKGEGEYVYLTVPQWIKYTYMLYERNIITDCIKELLAEGLIERRPIIMFYQKTFDYRLCTESIQNLIRSLPTKRKEDVFPNLDAYLTFKERGKTERAEKREKEGVSEKSRTSKKGKTEGKEVRELSPTVSEKSQGVGDNSPMVGDFSQEVREKSTQLILTKIPLTSTNIQESNVVSSDNESDDTLFSPSDDNQSSTDNVDNQTVNVDNTLQDDVKTSLSENTLAEEASERRIADVTTSDGVSESQPELPLERPKVPEMPPPGMRWSPKKMVMITECKRGSYYTEKMHESNLRAAQKIIKENVTEEEYIRAYEKRNDKWWKESRGPLDVTHMAAKTERGPMRTLEVLEELRYKQSNGHPTITDKANAKNTHSATQTYSPEDYDGGENERRQREAFMASQRGA